MQIRDNAGYRSAVEKASRLRDEGRSAEDDHELAELEAAIEHYDMRPDQPARSTGRPTSDPFDKDRT